MQASEASAAFADLVQAVKKQIAAWNERSPAMLASLLQDCSLPVILEMIVLLEQEPPEYVQQALAKLLIARYLRENMELDIFRAELWSLVNAKDLRWALRDLLMSLTDICRQQPRNHPNYGLYQALSLVAEEALQEIEGHLQTQPRRKRKRYPVSVARTAELPDLSSLTFEPVDSGAKTMLPGGLRRTGTLSQLPAFISMPHQSSHTSQAQWVLDWHALEINAQQTELLLDHLPQIYALISHWDPQETPLDLADILHPFSVSELIEIAGALVPHPEQELFLRYLALWLHLKLLAEDLPLLPETLRQIFADPRSHIQRVLPALGYYLYCSSHSFYGIQQQALIRLEQRQGYLYQLILDEWAKNKRIRSFMSGWLPRKEQASVKLLAAYDWEYIFFILNRSWARSVIRDVYGIFHGSSAFVNQIVQPETSRGFGNLRESSGVSFLATRQISDLLRKQPSAQANPELKLSQFDSFVSDRYRRDVLRKEQRPDLNSASLKRLERFAHTIQQRAVQQGLSLQVAAQLGMAQILQSYMYLSLERLEWLSYELTRIWLGCCDLAQPLPPQIEVILAGLFEAIASEVLKALPQRQQGQTVLRALLDSLFQAVLEFAQLQNIDPGWIREAAQELGQTLNHQAYQAWLPFYRQHFQTLLTP